MSHDGTKVSMGANGGTKKRFFEEDYWMVLWVLYFISQCYRRWLKILLIFLVFFVSFV